MKKKYRGVNLGGWLLLEKWITPSLFKNASRADDETTLSMELGPYRAKMRLDEHRKTFITETDFKRMGWAGINAVRIPVPFWIFREYPDDPFYKGTRPFITDGILDSLDQAVEWADMYGISVMIDLHSAPGCQNGFDNGGIRNVRKWGDRQENLDFTIEVLCRLARRFRLTPTVKWIEILNEPCGYDYDFLAPFYRKAADAIREENEEVTVVFHDGFLGPEAWQGFDLGPDTMLDIHRYRCFGDQFTSQSFAQHIEDVIGGQRREVIRITQGNPDRGLCIGEWSLGLDQHNVNVFDPPDVDYATTGMSRDENNRAMGVYGWAQSFAFEHADATFFWTLKTERSPDWDYMLASERGWVPRC